MTLLALSDWLQCLDTIQECHENLDHDRAGM